MFTRPETGQPLYNIVTGPMKVLWLYALTIGAGCAQQAEISSLTLKSTDGSTHRFRLADSRATAVVFISAVCPMSVEHSDRLSALARDYSGKDVRFLLVNSNVNETNAEVEAQRTAAKLPVPVYRDAGSLAATLGATATPTAVVIDQTGVLRYFGMIDNSRIPERVTKELLRLALNAVLAGRPVEITRTRVLGCAIKIADQP
jgi:hypothetical protein